MCACWRSLPFWQWCLMPSAGGWLVWALEGHLRASLATEALEMALQARRPAAGSLIHHSDRGVQYLDATPPIGPKQYTIITFHKSSSRFTSWPVVIILP